MIEQYIFYFLLINIITVEYALVFTHRYGSARKIIKNWSWSSVFLHVSVCSTSQQNNIINKWHNPTGLPSRFFIRSIDSVKNLEMGFKYILCIGWFMVFNATFNNISVIWGGQFYWWRKPEYLEKTTDLSQVTENFIT
jgi:hypothetical protein